MTPLKRSTLLTGGSIYPSPFVGPVHHTHAIAVDLSALTADEIDDQGYLKPAIPLTDTGILIAAASGNAVFGVTIEPLKVADDNEAATIAALGSIDVALAVICQVNRAVVEDILGRVLTADEIAGFDVAGSTVKLLQ